MRTQLVTGRGALGTLDFVGVPPTARVGNNAVCQPVFFLPTAFHFLELFVGPFEQKAAVSAQVTTFLSEGCKVLFLEPSPPLVCLTRVTVLFCH